MALSKTQKNAERSGAAKGSTRSSDTAIAALHRRPTPPRRSLGWLPTITTLLCILATAATSSARFLAEDGACERVARAPSLVRDDPKTLPPRHSAVSRPVTDVRRLFEPGRGGKTALIRRSIAEENPVLVDTGAFEVQGDLWTPAAGDAPKPQGDECGPTLAISYDDERQGGAFELMQTCGGSRDRFFWIRYEDLERSCRCAVEVVGTPVSAKGLHTLAGSVRFEDSTGGNMPARREGKIHRLDRAYPSGSRFRVIVTSEGPAYVYAFAADASYRVHPLFPGDGATAHLPYRQSRFAIPGESDFLQLDDKPGTDYFCAIFSTRKLDIDAFVRRLEAASGDMTARLQTVARTDLVQDMQVIQDLAGGIKFTANGESANLATLVFQVTHVR